MMLIYDSNVVTIYSMNTFVYYNTNMPWTPYLIDSFYVAPYSQIGVTPWLDYDPNSRNGMASGTIFTSFNGVSNSHVYFLKVNSVYTYARMIRRQVL